MTMPRDPMLKKTGGELGAARLACLAHEVTSRFKHNSVYDQMTIPQLKDRLAEIERIYGTDCENACKLRAYIEQREGRNG